MVWGRLSWVVWLSFWVCSNTFVFNISNVSTVSISNTVGYNLNATIGKVDTIFTVGGVTITVFVGSKVRFGVVISYGITVLVDGWCIICWCLAVSRGRCVIWSRFVDYWGYIWSWFVYNNWGYIWSWFVYNWGMVRSWSWLVNRGRVVNWGWSWLVNRGSMVYWGSMKDWGSMVNSWVSIGWGMNWDMSWSVNGSTVLFTSIWIVYILWGGMGLARNGSMVSSMGFVCCNFDCRGVSVLDNLVAALVGQSYGQGSEYCDECLE